MVGLFISGPLSHFLYEIMNKVFAGKTGRGVKIGQLLFSNLIISPTINSGMCIKDTGCMIVMILSKHFLFSLLDCYGCYGRCPFSSTTESQHQDRSLTYTKDLLGHVSPYDDLCTKLFTHEHLGPIL